MAVVVGSTLRAKTIDPDMLGAGESKRAEQMVTAGGFADRAVDELRIFRCPIVVGGGTPFLPPVTGHIPLDLVETRTFASRVIYERSTRAR